MPDSVIKPWVNTLTWKAQSALMTAVRGCDSDDAPHTRDAVRWLRRQIFYDADVEGTFVKTVIGSVSPKVIKRELEYMSIHFVGHLAHGMQIIGYKHPDENVRIFALGWYNDFCQMLHCDPEPEFAMDGRLTDNREKV